MDELKKGTALAVGPAATVAGSDRREVIRADGGMLR